jgi:hypothetical protein
VHAANGLITLQKLKPALKSTSPIAAATGFSRRAERADFERETVDENFS